MREKLDTYPVAIRIILETDKGDILLDRSQVSDAVKCSAEFNIFGEIKVKTGDSRDLNRNTTNISKEYWIPDRFRAGFIDKRPTTPVAE